MTDEQMDALIDMLRRLEITEVSMDAETEVVMAGSGTAQDPFYEEGPFRQHRPTGRVTITIKGERP